MNKILNTYMNYIKILDLGCGNKKLTTDEAQSIFNIKGRIKIIGLDKYLLKNVNVVHNLEKIPLPFKKNYFDFVYASHSLEHVKNLIPLIDEVHRILKPNGIFKVLVPHFGNRLTFADLQHEHFFSLHSFDQFDPTQPFGSIKYTTDVEFRVLKKKIIFGGKTALNIKNKIKYTILKPWGIVVNNIQELWEKTLLCYMFPCGIEFDLKAIK